MYHTVRGGLKGKVQDAPERWCNYISELTVLVYYLSKTKLCIVMVKNAYLGLPVQIYPKNFSHPFYH